MADPTPPVETAAPPEEQDFLFRAQVTATELFLGYWHYGLYALGAVLAASFAYGTYKDYRQSKDEAQFASIAAIDHKMPVVEGLALYGIGPKDDPNDLERKATLLEGGRRYAAVAGENTDSAAVYAWLKAAEAFERGGDKAEATKATEAAAAVGASGLAGFVADSAWVGTLMAAARTDEATGLLRKMADKNTGLLAEESLIRLGEAYLAAGKLAEAKSTVEELNKRFPAPVRAEQAAALSARVGAAG